MEAILIESFQVYFIFFLIVRKWQIPHKLFNENSFWRKLLNCSFCFSFWLSVIAAFFGLFDILDFASISILVLFYDILFKKLA